MPFSDLRGKFRTGYPLARHTSWRVGGVADCCYWPANLTDLINFLRQLDTAEPLTWLGLGSNVLIRDGGIRGTVILTVNCLSSIALLDDGRVRAEAGVTCAKLAKFCVKQGFEEGVFFAGIPGTVGGALAMNAGAFQRETWHSVEEVELINRHGEIKRQPAKAFDIQYRCVRRPSDEYFAAGIFCFKPGDPEQAKSKLKTLLHKRNDSQPIGAYSCGSVFKNPTQDYAARLVEASGLKGYQRGGVCVSAKHANFILNDGTASAAEIETLIDFVRQEVESQHGVRLIPEVHILGVGKNDGP